MMEGVWCIGLLAVVCGGYGMARGQAVTAGKEKTEEERPAAVETGDDPNNPVTDPNFLRGKELLSDPNQGGAAAGQEKRARKYWRPRYHPQVTGWIFQVMGYPYYFEGQAYVVDDLSGLAAFTEERFEGDSEEQGENKAKAGEGGKKETGGGKAAGTGKGKDRSVTVAKGPKADAEAGGRSDGGSDPNAGEAVAEAAPDWQKRRLLLERCCDLVHRWRGVNESPGVTAEVVRAIELTRMETEIYRQQPKLAVQVKRTIGQINRTNRGFDLTHRLMMLDMLQGRVDRTLLSRMEKQLTDLQSMIDRLADYNDEIGVALGIGAFDREQVSAEGMHYGNLDPPRRNLYFHP